MILLETLKRYLRTGWIEYSAVIPTRTSTDYPRETIRFSGVDLTTGENKIAVGHRISWIQNNVRRYGIIDTVALVSSNTDINVLCYTSQTQTNYGVLDTTTYPISGVWFSPQLFPEGFTRDVADYTLTATNTSLATVTPPNTSVNSSGFSLSNIPIGKWFIGWDGQIKCVRTQGTGETMRAGIGFSTSAMADNRSWRYNNVNWGPSGSYNADTIHGIIEFLTTLASKSTAYLLYKVDVNSGTALNFYASVRSHILWAKYYYFNPGIS